MAAIFQLRRGTTDETLVDGELYLHKGSGSIQFGSGSNNVITLLPLNVPVNGNINLIGNISASGDVRIGGNIYLGDNLANDSVNVNSPFSGSIIPSGSNIFDLGSVSTVYRNVYANRISGSQITGSFTGSINGIDITEFSTSVDGRLDVIESKYATTGSNNFVGNQTITGSLIVSGSNIQFSGSNIEFTREWPAVGSQSHFLRLEPFTSSTGRYYEGLGVGIEHWDDGTGTYEHSLLIHSFDNDVNQNYGAELNVGPYRTHMRVYPSGSNGTLANVSVQELTNGKSQALVYGNYVQIGAFVGEEILIGNTGSLITITGSNMLLDTPLTSSEAIVASLFSGSVSGIGNVSEFSSSISNKFSTISSVTSSFDNRLSRLEESTQSLNDYTQSLKSAIDVTGGNLRILGDLVVDGNTTNVNTQNLYIEDKVITLASGSIDSLNSNGAGFEIAGAGVSMSWEHSNTRFSINTNIGLIGSISSSTIVGLNGMSVEVYSASVDNRLTNLEITSASILGHITDINAYTQSNDTLNTLQTTRIDQLAASTASINLHTSSVNGHIVDLNNWTASQNEKDVIISNITASYNVFTGSATASIVELFLTASNHEGRIDDLETKTTTLAIYTASIDDKFIILSNITASYNSHTASLNQFTSSTYSTFSQSVDFRLDELEYTASLLTPQGQAQAFESLEDFTASADSRLDNLELFTSSINTTIKTKLDTDGVVSGSSQVIDILDSLNTYTQSNDTTNTTQNNRLTSIELVTSSLSSTYEEKASDTHTLVSGSSQLTSSYDSRYVTLDGNQTINGTKTFNDIVVNGTGSFAYITSVSGSAKIIGDSYVILNNDTPTQRYAGIAVYDSGSATPTTASFNFDGETNDWFYEYSSSTVDYGVALFGPEYNTKGTATYPTNNKVQKGTGTHHLSDSNITDSGTLITLDSNVIVNGTILSTGTSLVSSSAQVLDILNSLNTYTGSNDTLNTLQTTRIDQLAASTGSINTFSSSINTTIKTKLNVEGVISGSSQVSLGSASGNITLATQTTGNYVASLVEGTGVTITNNIGENTTPTIAIGQAVGTSSNVQFGSIGVGTAASGVSGEIRATGDIIAYYASDERLKENITPIENAIDKINQMGGYNYDWKEGFETIHSHKGHDLGVIAQEVQSVLPEVVTERETGYLAVDYVKLVPVLIEAIKELSAKIDRLENK